MKTAIRPIGNSRGVIIPKSLLAQVGLSDEAEITVEQDALVIRRPTQDVRKGWAEAARAIAEEGDDTLVLPDFPNAGDEEWVWE